MITFIICSIAPERAHALEQNIQRTIGETPYEIIIFDNRQTNYSIAKAYNLCASKARYAYLCFLHEDIAFHSRNWGKDIIHQLSSDNCGIIGFSGSILKTQCISGVHPYNPLTCHNYIQKDRKYSYFFNSLNDDIDYKACITVDGMCMFVPKTVWNLHHFDEQTLTGFHGYDLDFSLQVAMHHQNYICNTIIIEHFSNGSYTTQWVNAIIALDAKWKDKLPLSVEDFSEKALNYYEEEALFLFLKKALRTQSPYKDIYPFLKDYWKRTHFKKHSLTLLLKLISNRLLHIKA